MDLCLYILPAKEKRPDISISGNAFWQFSFLADVAAVTHASTGRMISEFVEVCFQRQIW